LDWSLKLKEELINDYVINEKLDIEKIFNNYYNYVFTIVINMSKGILTNEDIEEIISDTFFILWKNANRLDKQKKIKPYIAGITKNLVKEKKRNLTNVLDIEDYENTIESTDKVDFIIEQREEIRRLSEIVKKMKEGEKEVFELYYFKNMRIKEIAMILNVSEFNVKQKLYRIRKQIKKKGGYSYGK